LVDVTLARTEQSTWVPDFDSQKKMPVAKQRGRRA